MTTLIIEIPDRDTSEISNIVRARGGNVVQIDAGDEDLTPAELALLKRGLNEALLIKEGKIKSIPFSDLWND
jgi:electron transfer flavoprotein alpha/beta subunit